MRFLECLKSAGKICEESYSIIPDWHIIHICSAQCPVHSLLPFSAPITCAITMTALMHLHGSSHIEKGTFVCTRVHPHIIKCLSWWRSLIRSPLKRGYLSCTRSKSLTIILWSRWIWIHMKVWLHWKRNLDIPASEMMKQLVEVTKIISQNRIQQNTLEQTRDSNVLHRDRPQRLHDVIMETNQDSTNETRNTGKGMNENQIMTEGMTVDKSEIVEWKRMWYECHDQTDLHRVWCYVPVCSMSLWFCSVCWNAALGLSGTLQNVTGALSEKRDVWQRSSRIALQWNCWYLETVDWEIESRVADSWEDWKMSSSGEKMLNSWRWRVWSRTWSSDWRAEVKCISDYYEET